MNFSDEYLEIKKIVAIEEISNLISKNKECWDVDLKDFFEARFIVKRIEEILEKEKEAEITVKEIREIFKRCKDIKKKNK